jgi:DNA-binding transcriptional ArsR family regulator
MLIGGKMVQDTCEYLSVDNEKVDRIKKALDSDEILLDVSELFKLLSDNTRIKIIQALQSEELCVCDIAALIGLSQPSVSHHLRALRHSGVVKFRKKGKMALYSLADSRLVALLAVARDFTKK